MKAPYRSQSVAWAASSPLQFPLDFLLAARGRMGFPVIRSLKCRIQITGTTGSAGMQGNLMASVINRITLKDAGGVRCDVTGYELREIDVLEYGLGHDDPADIAASQGATSREFWLVIPCRPLKAAKRSDFGLAVEELVLGGSLEIQTAAALLYTNGMTVTSGSFQFYADIVDEHNPYLLSRMVWQSFGLTSVDMIVALNGRIRALLATMGPTNELAGTGWTAHNVTSRNLDIAGYPHTLFQDDYTRESKPSYSAAAAANSDPFLQQNNFSVPVLYPEENQSILDMPDVTSLQYAIDIALPANSPRLIVCAITNRVPEANDRIAALTGMTAADALAGAMIKGNKGVRPVDRVGNDVARRLPLAIPQKAS